MKPTKIRTKGQISKKTAKAKPAEAPAPVVIKTPPPPPPKKVPPLPPGTKGLARGVAVILKGPNAGTHVKVPPPPPLEMDRDIPADSVLKKLVRRPVTATHIEYSRPPNPKTGDPGVTIVAPFNCYGDFSSFKEGTVRWGRLRYDEDFIPEDAGVDDTPPAIKPNVGATEADLPPRITKVSRPKEGVCAFIDGLIMEGGRTAEEIRDLTLARFPGRDEKATLATVRTRPSHIKAKGLVPPAFAK